MDYVDRKYGPKPTKLAGGPPRPRKPLKGQASFWEPKDDNGQWKPRETLPDLSLHNEVWLDTEYDKHKKTKQQITPCGISIAFQPEGQCVRTGYVQVYVVGGVRP